MHKAKKSLGLKTQHVFVRAKKALGQNFLKSQQALVDIIRAGEVNEKDTVLEIGPGKGALTERLLAHAGKVVAIEKDTELFTFLSEKFADEIKNKKFILLNDDVLEFDEAKFFAKEKYKLIANIPYNITGAILKKFLSSDVQPNKMVLLVQKEVAERIVARNGKESILSMSVKAYGTPKYIAKVPARYFSPAPKVDSAIIAIQDISKSRFASREEENNFFSVLKAGFAHKRKMLAGNLADIGIKAEELFPACGIDMKARAEDITLDAWMRLAKGI